MSSRALGLLVAALATLVGGDVAVAAPGDLAGQSCVSRSGGEGCTPLAQPGMLDAANGVVVAPDGTDVYVGAAAGVAHFRRAPDGSLSYASCFDTSPTAGSPCPTTVPAEGQGALSLNAINLAISPDGKSLYAVSWADSLLWWNRDPVSGALTWGGCRDAAANAAANGHCGTATTFGGGNFPAGSMDYPQGISVSSDGQTVYIGDQTEGLLAAQRNTTTGVPTPTSCFNNTGSQATGCVALAAGVPMAVSGIDVAANGRDVYLRSISPGGITHFSRSGSVTSFASCVGSSFASPPCTSAAPMPVFAYSGSLGVAGDTLFTHGGNYGPPTSGTTARFTRNADGSLAFVACATTESSPGPCAPLPAKTAGGGIGRLLVSPDASSVYLAQLGNAERALTRLTGSLSFASCLSDTGVAACSAPPLPGPFAVSPGQMALSPDGRQIYQAADEQLTTFAVEQAAGPAVPAPAASAGKRKATAPKIRSVKRDAKGRYLVKVKVFQAGPVTARFLGKLKPKGKPRTLGKVARKRASGPGVLALLVKPSAPARERRLRAKLVVEISPSGYLPAQSAKGLRLR
ncbi:MAG TPA: hypothetical protein VHR18_10685 [Solirubrobacterales bacterium]|jgi:hypothetical protein|nr:hypothetical protein [Solirubrobacterales bacterium]